MVVSHADQRLELRRGRIDRPKAPETMSVGAEIVGKLVRVTSIRLGTRCSPKWPRCVERVGMDRDHRMAAVKQSVDYECGGGLYRNRQLPGLPVAGQPHDGAGEIRLVVGEREMINDHSILAQHRDIVGLARPVPAHLHAASLRRPTVPHS